MTRREQSVVTVNSVITLGFTAIFMPWAFWMSSQILQTRVDLAIIKTKLRISKNDYDAYFHAPGSIPQFAVPSLISPPNTQEEKKQ